MVAEAKRYCSNTELYQDPELAEGVDYGRRHRRHELFDDSLDQQPALARTTIIAPHGGGIETGTSELCLAVAGYHPATLEVTPPGDPTYDYWMFEGLRPANNDELHVTSTRCDDGTAVSFCAGSLNALALHGCRPDTVGLPPGSATVLVGGRNFSFKQYLLGGLRRPPAGRQGRRPLQGDQRRRPGQPTSSTAPCWAWAGTWS